MLLTFAFKNMWLIIRTMFFILSTGLLLTKIYDNNKPVKYMLIAFALFSSVLTLYSGAQLYQSYKSENIKFIHEKPIKVINDIPAIYGMRYSKAREALVKNGWMPTHIRWQELDGLSFIANLMWNLGFTEVVGCFGTGMGFCKFLFYNTAKEWISITTAGELIDEDFDAYKEKGDESKFITVYNISRVSYEEVSREFEVIRSASSRTKGTHKFLDKSKKAKEELALKIQARSEAINKEIESKDLWKDYKKIMKADKILQKLHLKYTELTGKDIYEYTISK